MATTLILGGVKSGKSALAEQLALDSKLAVTYIATASADDSEMQQRITQHRQRRPSHWQTIEEPIHLAKIISKHANTRQCILVDCLTLWLTNLLMLDNDAILKREIDVLVSVIKTNKTALILVSNEANMGIMPLGELSRRYCDEVGVLHQRIAQCADNVILTVAGLPHILKGKLHA